jgi:hypothetical protein
MWRTLLVLIVLTALSLAADAQERRIDVRIPDDSGVIQRLATTRQWFPRAGCLERTMGWLPSARDFSASGIRPSSDSSCRSARTAL